MPASSRSPVIFDLGGVLVDWNPRHLYRKLFDDAAAMEHFLEHVCNDAWNIEQDRGRSFRAATELLAAQHPAQAALVHAYRERWPEMLNGTIPGSVEILDELRARRTPLYALTNWSAETFPIARPKYPFFEWFKGIVVSGEEKLIKPDPRIFLLLLDRYGLPAAGTVYIDDNARNVEAAAKLGLHAIRFTDAAALRRELAALGLL